MLTVNTVGKSAREASDLTSAALKKFTNQNEQEIQVIVEDTMSAFEIQKILENFGLSVSIEDDDGRMTLFGSVKAQAQDKQASQQNNLEQTQAPREKFFEHEQPQNFSELEPQKFLEQTQAPREKISEREQPQNFSELEPQKFLEQDQAPREKFFEHEPQNNFQQEHIKEEEDFKNLNNNKEVQELNLKVKQALAEKEQELKPESGGVFLIMGKTLGRGDDKLGGILIKGFLAGLARSEPVPESIILLNDGVKLALFDSSTCDHLKDLESRGTQILISGVCTSHFGITDSIGAGVIANIYEIVDVINKANKVVSL